jgi:hypothetical protein
MHRNEAVSYLKDLLSQCNDLSPNAVSFEKNIGIQSTGYIIHIKGNMHESEKQTVRNVAQKYCLQVKENTNDVIVYKPK